MSAKFDKALGVISFLISLLSIGSIPLAENGDQLFIAILSAVVYIYLSILAHQSAKAEARKEQEWKELCARYKR